MKEKTKKLTYYLTIDRNSSIKVRKQKWQLDDGELRVVLQLSIPERFFKKPQIETTVDVKVALPPENEIQATAIQR